jgi:carbonic anhydrase
MISALEALARLRDGNQRFAAGRLENPRGLAGGRQKLNNDQAPFAIILGCSDSRVPAELVFDQGFGDLFVIRVAGNITQPSQIGSVEYAATAFGTRLVVILGHSRCGAIEATLRQLTESREEESPNMRVIVECVRPSVEALLADGPDDDPGTLVGRAVRANVRASVAHMRRGSEIIEALERDEGLLIIGADYSLETGLVDFFAGVPEDY